MLGWGVRVYQDTEARDEFVAGWTADACLLSTLGKLITDGKAEELSNSGGYPNWYSVDASILLTMMSSNDPELRLHSAYDEVFWKKGLLKVTTEKLLVEIWDQS